MSRFSNDYGFQAFRILQVGFIVLPIVAGLDKFFNLLTDWSMYLSPMVSHMLNGRDHGFMMLVGVIEIAAGIGVALRPREFSYIVCFWLIAITLNLFLLGPEHHHLDVALRDVGLAISAFALGKLSVKYA